MEKTTAEEPSSAQTEAPNLLVANVAPVDITTAPLDLIEPPKIRSKIRLYAILIALYVCHLCSTYSMYSNPF